MNRKPIEIDFPIEQVNEIAKEEGKGGTSRPSFEPLLYIHKWWAKRLGSVFRTIVLYTLFDPEDKSIKILNGKSPQNYSTDNLWNLYLEDVDLGEKIVLDPFMGAGTTVIEALRCNCKVIAQDLNPVAWFTVKKAVEPVDVNELNKGFKKLEEQVSDELRKYYRTICPHCLKRYAEIKGSNQEFVVREILEELETSEDPRKVYERYRFDDFTARKNIFADAMYYFWIKEIPCLNCDEIVPLFKSYMFAHEKKGKQTLGYYIICPECGRLFLVDDYQQSVNCPNCEKGFNPQKAGRASGEHYICQKCGQKNKIVEAIKRTGKPSERLYAIEYHCPSCNEKGYKKVDDFDKTLFEKAKSEFKVVDSDWLGKYIPATKIPKGQETYPRLIENHGYKYWKDMFNERQLLSLGKLLRAILELDVDENVREFLILNFSNFLDNHNMLCEYHLSNRYISHMFRVHAFHPSFNPTENNIWGARYGFGTFSNMAAKTIEAKKYNENPFEKFVNSSGINEKKDMKIKVLGRVGDIFENDENSVMLLSGDSSYLPIPDRSVDVVITDPPYFGNVMYSELADFFYVWLRLALKDKYECFQGELSPKSTEILVKKVDGEYVKSPTDFVEGLTSVFKESNRKLKDDGLLVFTFHHKETQAWGAVLESVLNAGFYVSAIYPIQSEMTTSTHIFRKGNVEYDMIIVCRKRETEPEREHWSQLEDWIYFKVEDELKRLEKHKRNLSSEDVFVVTIGKCLEAYSKHYPNVYKGEKQVSIEEALSSIREIVDSQLMHTRFNQVAQDTDTLTAVYLFYLARKTNISYESLNKALKIRGLGVKEVIDAGLVEKEGNQLLILTPKERKSIIESKRNEDLAVIDKAHYFYLRWREGTIESFLKSLDELEYQIWVNDKIFTVNSCLAESESDKEFEKINDYLKKRWSKIL